MGGRAANQDGRKDDGLDDRGKSGAQPAPANKTGKKAAEETREPVKHK